MSRNTQTSVVPATEENIQAALDVLNFGPVAPAEINPIWYSVHAGSFASEADNLLEVTGSILALKDARRYSIRNADRSLTTHCVMIRDGVGLWEHSQERACATCPMNKYGTGTSDTGETTRGKACREKKLILIIRDEDALPIVVAAPPTSLRTVATYQAILATRGKPLFRVKTKLTSKTVRENERQYGTLEIANLGDVTPTELTTLAGKIAPVKGAIDKWIAGPVQDAEPIEGFGSNADNTIDGTATTAGAHQDAPPSIFDDPEPAAAATAANG